MTESRNAKARKWIARGRALLRQPFVGFGAQPGQYYRIALTDEDIETQLYKQHLGGGVESWDSRGAFQLHFLQLMGMKEGAMVLDIGCGPGRAARHLIDFLEESGYLGYDYNADFVKAAREMTAKAGLAAKKPVFKVVTNFSLKGTESIFDYALAFSVLNHCTDEQRIRFFGAVRRPMKLGGKVYITHAGWFEDLYIKGSGMKLTRRFGPDLVDITRFGWDNRDEIFPIVELTRKG